jgi:hypothetical protein
MDKELTQENIPNTEYTGLSRKIYASFKAIWPFIIIMISGEILIRVILKATIVSEYGLNQYITFISEGISQKLPFGQIFNKVLPIVIPIAIFIGVRNIVDIFINSGAYRSSLLFFREQKITGFKDIIPNTTVIFIKYTIYRILLVGIWVAFLVFSAIVLSSLMLVGLFLGELAVPFSGLLIALFLFAVIVMPLRISLTFSAAQFDGYANDDAMKQSVKATSKPYNYTRLLLLYIPATILQALLIWIPLGSSETPLLYFIVTSVAAGFLRLFMICIITSAYIEMRKPREIDLNSIW